MVRWIVALAVVIVFGLVYFFDIRPWLQSKTPQQVITEVDKICYRTIAWDDAYDLRELIFVIFAAQNLSKELNRQPCDIYKEALTIRAPSQSLHPLLNLFGRKIGVVDLWASTFTGENAWKARAEETFDKIFKDRAPFIKEYPWLACVTRYIRSRNRMLAWTDEEAMRREMNRVYISPLGGEFFCPKVQKQAAAP